MSTVNNTLTIDTLIAAAATLPEVEANETKTPTLGATLRRVGGTVKKGVVTSVKIVDEGITITNDVMDLVPATITTGKEGVSLTNDFVTTVTKRTVMSEEQVLAYDSLEKHQRKAVRKGLTKKAAFAFADFFKEDKED